MINKLISSLPFSPSLINQVGFYIKRLRKETSIRRTGLVLLALSMAAQSFVVISPSQRSLASSDMNIIKDASNTRDDLVAAWTKSGSDVDDIYKHFGVSLDDIKDLTRLPNVTIRSNERDYWSTSRKSLDNYSYIADKYKKAEITIEISPTTTIYMRPLRAWDINNPYNTYRAWHGKKKSDGKDFWIVADCGNYIQVDKPKPVPPTLEIKKTILPKTSELNPGDTIKFRIEYRNKVSGSLAENAVIEDQFDLSRFDIVSPSPGKLNIFGNIMKYKLGDLGYSKTSRVLDITARLKTTLKDKQKICNTASIDADNADKVKSTACSDVTVDQVVPPGSTKTVKNITQNLEGDAAINSRVKPGDVIEYTLTTTNTNKTDQTNYTIKDDVSDLLDYADLDLGFLSSHGGVYSKDLKSVVWASQTLKAGQDTVKSFRIKMKDPVPTTNSPSPITDTFDCKITNEYGDQLTMQVQCPIVKNIEKLPNTGPGETLAVAFVITALGGYFFTRSRLLTKELEILRRTQASSGGGE